MKGKIIEYLHSGDHKIMIDKGTVLKSKYKLTIKKRIHCFLAYTWITCENSLQNSGTQEKVRIVTTGRKSQLGKTEKQRYKKVFKLTSKQGNKN